jgi:hypothetical protein
MKKQLAIIFLITSIATTIYALSLGNTVYSQQQQQQGRNISILDSVDVKNTNLTLGKPFYTERFVFPKSQNLGDSKNNDASASSVYSFKGNGSINDLQIAASGVGNEIPRGDGTSFLNGRALFTSSQNGTASYTFEAITNTTKEGIKTGLGTAFFDANATGDLKPLKSIVGVYESYIDQNEGKGIFAIWHIKDLIPK